MSTPRRSAHPSMERATALVVEAASEVPIGRRGSKQSVETVNRLLEHDLPALADAVSSLGGVPVSLIHTELVALLPPDPATLETARSRLGGVVDRGQSTALGALATGLVHRQVVTTAEGEVPILSGPALRSARDAVATAHASRSEAAADTGLTVIDSDEEAGPEGAPDFPGAGTGPGPGTSDAGPSTADAGPDPAAGPPQWEGSQVTAAVCAVAFELGRRAAVTARRIIELAHELGGEFQAVTVRETQVQVLTLFELSAEASERRAADFALLVRERYEDRVKCAVGYGTCVRGRLRGPGWAVRALAGAPVVIALDLLEHADDGQVVVNGASAERLSDEYAVQPVGGVNRGGKRTPAGTTLLLWREYPVQPHGIFVGRESELEQIQEHLFSHVAETLHVTGPPGIGKSSLVQQIVRSRPASSVLIVAGSDNPEAPFSSIIEGLQEYWDLPPRTQPTFGEYLAERLDSTGARLWDEELLAEYERLRHFVEHAFGVESSVVSALDPESRYTGIRHGLATLLSALQAIRILFVDDQQWLDSPSVEVLESWVGSRDPRRLRVVTTVRTQPAHAVTGLGRESREFALSGLSDSASVTLLKHRGTDALVSAPEVDAIISRCGGNPFFLEQCVRFVEEEVEAGETPVIPDSVYQVILARINRLTHDVREAVEMAAVLGLRFDMRILSAMLREEEIPNALRSAEREGFWESVTELNFIFCHALIRDAVYDAQLAARRADLHAAAVRAFEQVYTGETRREHLYQLAEHCERAGRTKDAIDYLSEAADYAFEQYETERGVELLRRRLALAGESDLRAVNDLAGALKRTAAWEEAGLLLERVVERGTPAESADEASAFSDCCATYADLLIERGEQAQARRIVELGLKAIEGIEYEQGRAFLHRCLGVAHFRQEEYQEALDEYQCGLDHARASGDRKTIARLLNEIAIVHARTGRHNEALEAFQSNLELARELNDSTGISSVLNNLGYLYNQMGEHERALPYFREDLELCVEAGLRQGQAIAIGNIASVLASLGRHEEAISQFADAIEIDAQIGFLPHKAYNLQQLGSSLIATGENAEGCRRLREALELASEIDFPMVTEKTAELVESCPDGGDG